MKQFLEDLCHDMEGMLSSGNSKNAIVVEGIALRISTTGGIPTGFIVSELITNSAKYANGRITVSLGMNDGKGYALSVSDDGRGLPKGFDPKKSTGLGMKIVSSLVKQIDGQLLFDRGETGRGARFTVFFS